VQRTPFVVNFLTIVALSSYTIGLAASGPSGLIVFRAGTEIKFSDASSLLINGKDKALNGGTQPETLGALNKLPSVKLGGPLMRDGKTGALLSPVTGGQPQVLLPMGLPKGAGPDIKALWKDAQLSYRPSASDKTAADIPTSDVIAFLPNGSAGLPALCADAKALAIIAGPDDVRTLQSNLITAAVKAFSSQQPAVVLENYVRSSMAGSLERFSDGFETSRSLDEGLHFARISEAAFPSQSEQNRLREDLRSSRAWLDRRVAMLKAFAAGEQYDAYILGYREFEKHQSSFPDLTARHRDALKQSIAVHRAAGVERLANREYKSAYRELKLASFREPSNSALQKELSVAWAEFSREIAVSRQLQRKQLSGGQLEAIKSALFFAKQYNKEQKLDEALKSVLEAEAIYPRHLPTLLVKAEVYAARNEMAKALEALDEYDMNAVDDDRTPASDLRNQLTFRLQNSLSELKSRMSAAWTTQRYTSARKLAFQFCTLPIAIRIFCSTQAWPRWRRAEPRPSST